MTSPLTGSQVRAGRRAWTQKPGRMFRFRRAALLRRHARQFSLLVKGQLHFHGFMILENRPSSNGLHGASPFHGDGGKAVGSVAGAEECGAAAQRPSEASYRLSVRAQKLLIRLLDELDQRGDNFCDIKLFLKDFSGLLSADPPETVKRFLDSSALFVYEIHLERVDCVRAYR